jgi:hypothetical protein
VTRLIELVTDWNQPNSLENFHKTSYVSGSSNIQLGVSFFYSSRENSSILLINLYQICTFNPSLTRRPSD